MNFGAYETVARASRIESRSYGEPAPIERVRGAMGRALLAADAFAMGLVTATPDSLDWDNEVRLALEERASLSPDALTGLEASLRFGPRETLESRIFGRLSAWQNWIFVRPNAVGESGTLKVFGTGRKARFDWDRI
jgi:benzoyl-CoA-dihydrodiol lyase